MALNFIGGKNKVWTALRKAFGNGQRAHVAVAFLGKGASARMRLAKGSVLVVNAAEDTVQRGLTAPSEILKYIDGGVNVYSYENLHAKVFVVGRRTFVGSANASKNSEANYTEALIASDDPAIRNQARGFVTSLALQRIGPEEAKRLEKLYQPPRPSSAGPASGRTKVRPLLAPVSSEKPSASVSQAFERGQPNAERRLRDSRYFRIDTIWWTGSGRHRFTEGRQVYQVVEGDDGKKRLYPPGHVLASEPFTDGAKKGLAVFLELPKNRRARPISSLRNRLGTAKKLVMKLQRLQQIPTNHEEMALARLFA